MNAMKPFITHNCTPQRQFANNILRYPLDGDRITKGEQMSSTTECLAGYIWFTSVDNHISQCISRVYAHDLQLQ